MHAGSESELIARCRRGEADAWNELFDLHYSSAGRFIFQLSYDFTREDAEEICQEVFLSVIRSLDAFHGECRFQTWLFRIAANKARDFRQKERASKRGGGQRPISLQAEDPNTGLTIDPPGADRSPDLELLNSEQFALLHDCLDGMGDACREMIQMRYFAELSYEEIGAATKLNTKTVSSRLSRCLDKLEELFRGRFAGEKSTVLPSNR
jgi:RNA polymerase sigma-70 factor, ECF subfamily